MLIGLCKKKKVKKVLCIFEKVKKHNGCFPKNIVRVLHVWGFWCFLCVSRFCPLERVAAWIVAVDRVQLGLFAISGGFRAAAPELQRGIVNSPAMRVVPGSLRLNFACV